MPPTPAHILALLLALLCGGCEEQVSFQQHIRPVLDEHCVSCHNPQGTPQARDLDLHTLPRKTLLEKKLVLPGAPQKSLLYHKLGSQAEVQGARMPPYPAYYFDPETLRLFEDWIRQGAK